MKEVSPRMKTANTRPVSVCVRACARVCACVRVCFRVHMCDYECLCE